MMIKQRTFSVDWFIDCVQIVCDAPSGDEWRDDFLETFLSDRESSAFLQQNLATFENYIGHDAQRIGVDKGEWIRVANEWLPRNAKDEITIEDKKGLSDDLITRLTQQGYTRFDKKASYEDIVLDAAIVRGVLKTLCLKFIEFASRTERFMDDDLIEAGGVYRSGYEDGYEQAKQDMIKGILK